MWKQPVKGPDVIYHPVGGPYAEPVLRSIARQTTPTVQPSGDV
jgi:hypothetical protein